MIKINNIVDIKDYLFKSPVVFRDKYKILFVSRHTRQGDNDKTFFVEIIQGGFSDEELLNICNPERLHGGTVQSLNNGVIEVKIYND